MKHIHKSMFNVVLCSSIFICGGQEVSAIHPLAERVVKIINKDGQSALCKKGGVFRERVGLTIGKNCDNHDFAEFAATACSRNGDFDTSECYNIITKNLGGAGIVGAPAAVEQSVKLKHANTYAMVCTTKRENLEGILKAIADRSCGNNKSPSITPVLTIAQKQKLKAIVQKDLQTVEAIKIWISATPTSQRGQLTIGSQRGLTIKAPAPTDPSKTKTLVDAADNLSKALKKLNTVLDTAQEIHMDPPSLKKLDDFSTQINETSSIEEMLKKLAIMENLMEEINAQD